MPIGPISAAAGVTGAKDLVEAYKPLLLSVFTWFNADGVTAAATLRLSTSPLNVAEGGVQYSGQDYQARLLDQNIDAVAAMSDTGIDIPPTLSLKIADADRAIWSNYESVYGFKGAQLAVYLVLWQVDTANFSSEIDLKFLGTANPATLDDEATLSVSAISKLNMQKILLPLLPVETRCPWIFPDGTGTAANGIANRTAAHFNTDSPFFPCGYSADIAGGQGLMNGSVPFTFCDYTKTACLARGMYNAPIGHFGGSQWQPPLWWKGKSYLEGKTIEGINSPNAAKYSQYCPMVYGKTFVTPVILNVIGDANATRMEMLCCFGNVGAAASSGSTGGVQMVIVNDIALPFSYASAGGAAPVDGLFNWNYVNCGFRDSQGPNRAPGYTDTNGVPQGDPYGNLCVVFAIVPKVVADSSSIPGVQILMTGPKLRVYTSPTVFTNQVTSNPVWILMDLLIQSNWLYKQLNIQSFINAAAVCDVTIGYLNNAGNFGTHNQDGTPHHRYSCSLSITNRRTAADVIHGVRNACKGMLVPNDATGLLQIFIKQTLADQQTLAAGPIVGSNNASQVPSIHADGTALNGYSAYDFDESSILVKQDGSSTLTISQRTILNSPNRISANFMDQDNQWVQDSITEVDPVDIGRAGQEVVNSVQADGINSYDQGRRIFEGIFAETYRGNARGDSGGTYLFEFQTTQKVAHLHVGHLCRFSHQQLGLALQMVRVIKLQPSRDHETVKISLQWHSDVWYTDTYGQQNTPIYSTAAKNQLARPPFGWQPFNEAPLASDQIFPATFYTFGMAQVYSTAKDGSAIVTLVVTGKLPVNSFLGSAVQPPLIGLQGTHTPGGGSIGSGIVHAVVCGYDANFKASPPTHRPCVIDIPAGDLNNSVTIPVNAWPPAGTNAGVPYPPAGYYCFAGYNPNMLTFQAGVAGTPANITLTSLAARKWGVPDVMFNHIELRVKQQIHGGVWGAAINTVTATTLQFLGSTFAVNQWAGYDLSIIGRQGFSSSLPVWNLRIVSNTADTLTVAPGTADLTTLPSADVIPGIHVGDVAVMRARPSVFTATTLGDANFVNNIAGGGASGGLAVNEGQNILRIFGGTGAGQFRTVVSNTSTVYTVDHPFETIPDATSRFWIEEANKITYAYGSAVQNADVGGVYSGRVEISNYNGESIVCQAVTVDSEGNDAWEPDDPVRDMWIFGQLGSVESAAFVIAFNV